MNNIGQIRGCYGCGVCAVACPKGIISLHLNVEGFYEPQIIDESSCINCGICLDVCAYDHDDICVENEVVASYAAWSKSSEVRKDCSSGGIGYEIGKLLLEQGNKVCAVKYNSTRQRAEHYIANTLEEFSLSKGSKYIQSYTVDAFKKINRRENYLVTGTPCQIASFRRYIRRYHVEDNFILLDFFCHGVPSILVWKKYIKEIEVLIGKVNDVSWRDKTIGWHDSWAMNIKGEEGSFNKRLSEGDLFYKFFLGNMCLGKACYENCRYKYDHSSADIRIGDMWGSYYKDEERGVSAVIAFTTKGNEIIKKTNCVLVNHPFEVVAEGQMHENLRLPKIREKVITKLQSSSSLESIMRYYKFTQQPAYFMNLFKKVIRKIVKICQKK